MWTIRQAIGRAPVILLCAAVAAGLAVAAWFSERHGRTIVGHAKVIDGDSLVIAGTEIRIYGMDAPESRQICKRAGRPWSCGHAATDAMRAMVANREVTCRPRDQDRYGRTVAICVVDGVDLGSAMVKAGNAVAYGAYDSEEREARNARRGVWSSTFERPAAWRARHPR